MGSPAPPFSAWVDCSSKPFWLPGIGLDHACRYEIDAKLPPEQIPRSRHSTARSTMCLTGLTLAISQIAKPLLNILVFVIPISAVFQ